MMQWGDSDTWTSEIWDQQHTVHSALHYIWQYHISACKSMKPRFEFCLDFIVHSSRDEAESRYLCRVVMLLMATVEQVLMQFCYQHLNSLMRWEMMPSLSLALQPLS